MDDLFKWAKDSPLAIITYFGLWFWTFEAVKAWVGSPPSWLTIIWVFVGVSLVAALGTLVIGWALRLGWRILQIAWRVVRPQRHSRMRQELQILSAKRQQETLAFAKSMIAGIEAKQLGLGEIGVLAELLSRPGRPVSGQGEVIGTLRCLLNDPDYLRPHFDSLKSEWLYEKQASEIVRPRLG